MDDSCFACGRENDHGLHLRIAYADGGAQVEFVPPAWTQGYEKVVHGGIIATLLDEVAVWAARASGHTAVTAEMTLRIRSSMKVAERYLVHARVTEVKRTLIRVAAEAVDARGSLIANASLKLLKIA